VEDESVLPKVSNDAEVLPVEENSDEAEDRDADTATGSPGLETAVVESAEPPQPRDVEVAQSDVASRNDDKEADEEAGQEAEKEAPPEPASRRCWLAGPVADDRTSEALSARFASASTSMDLILRTVEADPDYWVYLPTDGSQAEVRRLSSELREDGMDNFPITNGPLAGSLSLGLFRAGERARALREDLRNRGYDADIYQRPRYRDEAWIALDDEAREALGWPATAGAVPGFDRVMLEEQSCEPR
jgi:hypothetical protein